MPTASLLLLPLRRLLSLISSVLGLFPLLLRPPPMAARLSRSLCPHSSHACCRSRRVPSPSCQPRPTPPAAPPKDGPPLSPSPCGRGSEPAPDAIRASGSSGRGVTSQRRRTEPSPPRPKRRQKTPRRDSRVFWKKLLLRARPPFQRPRHHRSPARPPSATTPRRLESRNALTPPMPNV